MATGSASTPLELAEAAIDFAAVLLTLAEPIFVLKADPLSLRESQGRRFVRCVLRVAEGTKTGGSSPRRQPAPRPHPAGAPLVAKLINDHGSIIEFESEPRRAVFRRMLPKADQEAA